MKKIILLSAALMACSFPSLSNARIITCPESITCNYEEGTCDSINKEDWFISAGGDEGFNEKSAMNLSIVASSKYDGINYSFQCGYSYGNYSYIWLNKKYFVNKLIGEKWSFSGFGRQYAECKDFISPDDCAAEIEE